MPEVSMRLHFITVVFCLLLLSFATAQAQTPAIDRGSALFGSRSRFAFSDIDEKVVKEFNGAWQQCLLGTKNTEAVVLVLRDPDG
jgi:hypothetical protein